jgi:dTDP-4-amino-4,6-dideoxygalactose transaminase
MPSAAGPTTAGIAAGSDIESSGIPFVDLGFQNRAIADEVLEGWSRVVEEGAFVLGRPVARFEEAYAGFCGLLHCVGVGNGTDALELALRGMGLGRGDEVILPTNSFVATAEAVCRAGGVPVLVDVDPDALLIDPEGAAERIGPRTRAIVPVHLYGQVAPMEALQSVCEGRVALLEDVAQAQGATRNGRMAGGFGVASATSFYPSKNLGAYGDAGAVLTDSSDIALLVRALRDHGSLEKHDHPLLGTNSRLDTLQAVVLLAKLRHLRSWNELRREAAIRYHQLLEGIDAVRRPVVLDGNEHVWHLYVVRVARRDAVLAALADARIEAGVHYPVPIHLQGAFRHLGHRKGDLPVAEAAAGEILSLPIYPGITPAQQERVVDVLRRATG